MKYQSANLLTKKEENSKYTHVNSNMDSITSIMIWTYNYNIEVQLYSNNYYNYTLVFDIKSISPKLKIEKNS